MLLGLHWLSLVLFSILVPNPFIWTALEFISWHFSVGFSVQELYSSSTDAFDLQLCVLSVWVCSNWWQTSDLDVFQKVETTWKALEMHKQKLLRLFLNLELLTGHGGDLCANLVHHSCWLCGFACVDNCYRLLIDWHFGCRTGSILLHPSP